MRRRSHGGFGGDVGWRPVAGGGSTARSRVRGWALGSHGAGRAACKLARTVKGAAAPSRGSSRKNSSGRLL